MNTRFYDGLRAVLTPVYSLLWPSRVTGLEHIPDEGAFILCCNHMHWRDSLFVAARLKRRRYTFLAKAELFKSRIGARVLGEKGLGAIPVNRGHSDLAAIRAALKALSDGEALGIFPQGTRSRDNAPTPFLNGVSMIAQRARVPIIPVYIEGPYRLFRHSDVHVGAPVDVSDLGRKYDSETLSALTHRIEDAVWGLKGSTGA